MLADQLHTFASCDVFLFRHSDFPFDLCCAKGNTQFANCEQIGERIAYNYFTS